MDLPSWTQCRPPIFPQQAFLLPQPKMPHPSRRCARCALLERQQALLQDDGIWQSNTELAEVFIPRRIPTATTHAQVAAWCGAKPRLLILNRVDMVSDEDARAWSDHFARAGRRSHWTNAVTGSGANKVAKAAMAAGVQVNERRRARGLSSRPVRACVIGFPNVGKSALINRLLNRRACESAPRPGVTRNLHWLRMGGDMDLLDAPGVIPAAFDDQAAAQRLAMCNDIGEASYVASLIAAELVGNMMRLPSAQKLQRRLCARFRVPPQACRTGEDFVHAVAADDQYQGDLERAGQRILKDFRSGALGAFALELPPKR